MVTTLPPSLEAVWVYVAQNFSLSLSLPLSYPKTKSKPTKNTKHGRPQEAANISTGGSGPPKTVEQVERQTDMAYNKNTSALALKQCGGYVSSARSHAKR